MARMNYETGVAAIGCIYILFWLSLIAAVGYVAIHFIGKFW